MHRRSLETYSPQKGEEVKAALSRFSRSWNANWINAGNVLVVLYPNTHDGFR